MLTKLIAAMALWPMLLIFGAGQALAQTGVVTGTVTDSTTGEPLPGVNIVIEGLQVGAATSTEGQYEISNVPTGEQTLVASYVGYQTQRIPIDIAEGMNEVDFVMASQTIGLEDVVVTALGIEREERSLGYSVEEIEGAELENPAETNFMNTLAGRVAGAQVNTGSQMGGSTRIVLRGASSVTGNNQPLIIVDGVPLDNSNYRESGQESGFGGYDYGNAASIINPSDVQAVSVLKGPNAAALYGSRAANGVVLVTSRNGAGQEGIGVTVQTGATFQDLYGLPDYQDEYGGGAWAPFSMNGEGQLVADFATDQSWGPPLDGREVRQWYSYDNVNGLEGQATPWVAQPDNVESFFQTGVLFNTNVAFSQGGENFNYRLSVTNLEQEGVFPNSRLGRNTISFNGSLDLTERLSTSVSANYVDEDARARPGTGYTNATNPWLQFNQFGQRQMDLGPNSYMRDYRRPNGTQRGWNWLDPVTGDIIYANNPYWISYENFETDDMERLFGGFTVSYDFTEALSLTGSARTDFYTSRRQERVAIGSVEQPEYEEAIREVQGTNGSLELAYDGQLSEDFSLRSLAGTNYRYETRYEDIGTTQGGLSTPNLYNLENSISRPAIEDYFEEYGVFSLYGDVSMGYRELLYLQGTLRNDWSSTLPEGENSYLYPSVSASFVFSELGGLQEQDWLSYGKLRLGWSQVGKDTSPYRLGVTYPLNFPYGSTPLQRLPVTLNNPELKPEITSGWEVGTQLQFLTNRLGLDVTYYDQETRNQILAVEVSRASGYASTVVNAGTIANRGVELTLDVTPVLTESFQWDFTANWARNINEVVELQEGLESINIGFGPPFGPDIVARVGEPYGSFFGNGFVFDDQGNKVVSGIGLYESGAPRVLGSYLPDWTASFSTTLSFGGFSVSALFDGQKGGKIWSLSNLFGLYSGIFEETAENDIRELGIVPEGVTAGGEAWTDRVDPNLFFLGLFGNHEAHLYDASYIQLREVNLTYTLPQRWFGDIPVQSLSVSLIGRNLATLLKYTPNFDPAATTLSAGNVQGVEAGQMPPTRSYGVNLRLTL